MKLLRNFLFAIVCCFLSTQALANGAVPGCIDKDGDGWGVIPDGGNLIYVQKCKYKSSVDCNDSNKAINPSAKEVCYNSIDDNCNGLVDENCAPQCVPNKGTACGVGIGECSRTGTIQCDGSCSAIAAQPIKEVCGDGLDNDCDGSIYNGCDSQPLPGENELLVARLFKGSFARDNVAQVDFVVKNYKGFIFVEKGPSTPTLIKDRNPNALVLRYTKMSGSHGPETRPPSGDFYWSLANSPTTTNPNWLLGGMTQSQFGWHFIDIVNNDTTNWAKKHADFLVSDAGKYDGLFLDSAGSQHDSVITNVPTSYSADAYDNASYVLMKNIRQALPNAKLIPNGYSSWRPDGVNGMKFLDDANGIMFEGYATKVNGSVRDLVSSRKEIQDFCTATKLGQNSIATDYLISETDYKKRLLVFATYLLSANKGSYIYTIPPSSRGDVAYFPEDSISIGIPKSFCASESNGLFKREFTKVTVYANFDSSSKSISTPSTCQKLELSGNLDWAVQSTVSWSSCSNTLVLNPGEAAIIK